MDAHTEKGYFHSPPPLIKLLARQQKDCNTVITDITQKHIMHRILVLTNLSSGPASYLTSPNLGGKLPDCNFSNRS